MEMGKSSSSSTEMGVTSERELPKKLLFLSSLLEADGREVDDDDEVAAADRDFPVDPEAFG